MAEDDPRWSKHSDRVIVFCLFGWTSRYGKALSAPSLSVGVAMCGHWVQGFSSALSWWDLDFLPNVNGEDMGRHVWSTDPCTSASGWIASSANCIGSWPGKPTGGNLEQIRKARGSPPGLLSLLALFAHDRQSSQCDNPVWGEGHSRWISANCNLVGGFKHFLG